MLFNKVSIHQINLCYIVKEIEVIQKACTGFCKNFSSNFGRMLFLLVFKPKSCGLYVTPTACSLLKVSKNFPETFYDKPFLRKPLSLAQSRKLPALLSF